MSAASQARRRRPLEQLEIVAFERGDYTSYAACGLPYYVADDVDSIDDLIARRPEEFREAQDIDIRMRHEVLAIDLDTREVVVRDLDAQTDRRVGFDDLVIATGAVPRRPPLPNADAHGVFGIQTVGDGIALRDHVVAHEHERALVVGGGYIGLEMAEAMKRRGLSVTIIEGNAQLMTALDPEIAATL